MSYAEANGVVRRSGYSINDFPIHIEVTSYTQNIAANQSTVTFTAWIKSNNPTNVKVWDATPTATAPTLKIAVNGSVKRTLTVTDVMKGGQTKETSISVTFTHNSSGDLTLNNIQAIWTKNNSNSAIPGDGSVTISSFTLPRIARAAPVSLSKSSHTVSDNGTSSVITYSKNENNLYYKIAATCNGKTVISEQVYTNVAITNNMLLNAMSNVTSATLEVTLKTYSDSGRTNHIGTSTAKCSIVIDTSKIRPSISKATLSKSSSPTGISGILAGFSKVSLATTATASPGASITTTVALNYGSFTSPSSTTASSTFTSNTLPSSSSDYNVIATVTVRDSRGVSVSTTSNALTVSGYTKPAISASYYRCKSSTDSTPDAVGKFAYISFSATADASEIGNSISSVSATYKIGSGSSNTATSGSIYPLDMESQLTLTVTARDKVGQTYTQNFTIHSASLPLDLYMEKAGNSIKVGAAIGSVARANCFDVGLYTYLRKSVFIGEEKGDWHDGKPGWYFGADGTAHVSHNRTPGIYFHYGNSTSNYTSGIEGLDGNAIKLVTSDGAYVNKNYLTDGNTGSVLGATGYIYSYCAAGAYPSLLFRRASDNSNIAYLQAVENENVLNINASGGVKILSNLDVNGPLSRDGKLAVVCDSNNFIHFKWVSGTGVEVYVDNTKVATIRQGS